MTRTFTILVTANDTGVGKTWVSAEIARQFVEAGHSVRYTKPVETGCTEGLPLDAAVVKERNPEIPCETGLLFKKAAAPLAAACEEGKSLGLQAVLDSVGPGSGESIHILEGAGGIAVPLDSDGRDWLDFAKHAGVDAILVVVEDKLGAINQARMAAKYLEDAGIPFQIWPNDKGDSGTLGNLEALAQLGLPIANQAQGLLAHKPKPRKVPSDTLANRKANGLLRTLELPAPGETNLASNDYLGLANHPAVQEAASEAAKEYGTSASASPLVTGYLPIHLQLETRVCQWHGFPCGLVWNSGFQANRAVLSLLPGKGDVILADKLIHRSLVAGALSGSAHFQRYRHLDLGHLETLLQKNRAAKRIWVVTETLFSMDGDSPDFEGLSDLKRRYGFTALVDEAHALGWYGEKGSGLLEHSGAQDFADILVGTFGKALASQGAYTLFRDPEQRETMVNFSEDFIYSTYLTPPSAGSTLAAIDVVGEMARQRREWQAASQTFRKTLQSSYPKVPDGDSPIVPLQAESPEDTFALYQRLLAKGIRTAYIRPPTVPPGSTRLRISLKANLGLPALAMKVANA